MLKENDQLKDQLSTQDSTSGDNHEHEVSSLRDKVSSLQHQLSDSGVVSKLNDDLEETSVSYN